MTNVTKISDHDFRLLLDLIMCSDPWPVQGSNNQSGIEVMADKAAKERGFDGWVEAYHYLPST